VITLYLVDYNNLVHRFKATNSETVKLPSGVIVNVSVLRGVINFIRNFNFNRLIFCLDGEPVKTQQIMPEYKANRDHDLVDKPELDAANYDIINLALYTANKYEKPACFAYLPGYEADQVISSLVYATHRPELRDKEIPNTVESDVRLKCLRAFESLQYRYTNPDRIIIASSDADLSQLRALPEVYKDINYMGYKFEESVPASAGAVPPETIPVYKAFVGDTSDNIKGVITGRTKVTTTQLKELLTKHIRNASELTQFLRGELYHPELENLSRFISESGVADQVSVNLKVALLTFIATPFIITKPCITDEACEELLLKFKIK